jgi:thiol:disulfide interchange protein DsbD
MALPSVSELLVAQPLLAYPVVFAGGLLTSLTPCIYPMIPITVAVVGGQGAATVPSTTQAVGHRPWALTGAYVLGLSTAYAALGLVAGLTGELFGAISTNKWLLLGMGNLLLLFALMMLDVIPVPVPSGLLARAATMQSGGRLAGAFGMGAASGLVAAPCGAPVMAALLTWVASTHSAWRGFSYLFVFSLGMCALLVAVGLTAGRLSRIPRAGPWMIRVKQLFAVLMIGMSQYYLLQAGQVWF